MPIIMYTKDYCPFCVNAKSLLARKGKEVIEINVENNAQLLSEMLTKSNGARTVPQIFINDLHIGGFDDMVKLDEMGELDQLLAEV